MKKFCFISVIIIFFTVLLAWCFYIIALPKIAESPAVSEYLQKTANELLGADLLIVKPKLTTHLKPDIQFGAENIFLAKNGETILNLQNINGEIDLSDIFNKKIILKKLISDDLYIDINKLKNLKVQDKQETETKPPVVGLEWYDAFLNVKKCSVIYGSPRGVIIKLLAKDINIETKDTKRFIRFKILTDIDYNGERLRLLLADRDTIYIENNDFNVKNFKFLVNKSEVIVNALFKKNGKYNLALNSQKFEMKNIIQMLNTNLLVSNGRDVVSCFKDFGGDFNFNITSDNDGINGKIGINKISGKLIPLADIPLTLTKGAVLITPENIEIKDFHGYYGKSEINDLTISGKIGDYMKSAKSCLLIAADIYSEFDKYISKLCGVNISFKNAARTAFKIDFDATGRVNIKGGLKVPKKSDVFFDGASISSDKFDRAIGIDVTVDGENTVIEHVNYYIAEEIKKKVETKPLVTLRGKVNTYTGFLKELEFDVPNALPSEFFNVLVGRQVFRRGTFQGSLKYINSKIPKIDGKMILNGVFVSGQRFLIKNAEISADKDYINIVSDGTLRRTKYNFNAKILNKLVFPIITEKINIDIDEIDVEKVMQTFAPVNRAAVRPANTNVAKPVLPQSDVPLKYFELNEKTEKTTPEAKTDEDAEKITFRPNLLVIKECLFNVKNGAYKLIKFGNLNANLTLSADGLLEIKSNRFDFAEGISSLKVDCDLYNEKYSIKLGAKNVNANTISSVILNLDNEISGKASSIMHFYTDSTGKLNGKMKFSIKDGEISKLGLVQYLLNLAVIFRNPLAMVSPTTLADIINIPDGNFKSINGNLEIINNVIERMMIQSSSPQLSSFIIGNINLENMDASLRIYTKFVKSHKGIAGALRNLSLSSLSKKMMFAVKEDASYYAADLSMLPKLETGEETAKVFLTIVDGDIQSTNFISSLRQIK